MNKQNKIIIYFFLINALLVTSGDVFSQTLPLRKSKEAKIIELNDTTKLRIYDGQIVDETLIITQFESVKYLGRMDPLQEVLKSKKLVLVINSPKSSTESELIKRLFSQKDFIENFKYPLDTRLPIAINSELLTQEKKERRLSEIKMGNIVSLNYLDTEKAKMKYQNLPFGVIEIRVEK